MLSVASGSAPQYAEESLLGPRGLVRSGHADISYIYWHRGTVLAFDDTREAASSLRIRTYVHAYAGWGLRPEA